MIDNKNNKKLQNRYSARTQCPELALKDEVKCLKGKLFWGFFECYKENITAYQVAKEIEPEKVKYIEGSTSYPKKWRNYANGKNAPQRKTALSAEKICPGISKWFLTPFWLALQKRNITDKELDSFLHQIKDKDILTRVTKKQSENSYFTLRDSNLEKLITFLTLQNSPDALSALTLLYMNLERKKTKPMYRLTDKWNILFSINSILISNSAIFAQNRAFKKLYYYFEKRLSYMWIRYDEKNYKLYTAFSRSTREALLISHHYFFQMRLLFLNLTKVADYYNLFKDKTELSSMHARFSLCDSNIKQKIWQYLSSYSLDQRYYPKGLELIQMYLLK